MPTLHLHDRPHNREAERTTLGALLLDPERFTDVASTLRDDDFHDPVHQAIFAAMRRLYDDRTAIDPVTVANGLTGDDAFRSAGGIGFLAELSANVPTSSLAATYAGIVRDKALHRRLAQVAGEIHTLAGDEDLSALEALEQAEQKLLGLSRHLTESKPQHIADIGAETFERYARLHEAVDKTAFYGLTTGFRDLDQLLTGQVPVDPEQFCAS